MKKATRHQNQSQAKEYRRTGLFASKPAERLKTPYLHPRFAYKGTKRTSQRGLLANKGLDSTPPEQSFGSNAFEFEGKSLQERIDNEYQKKALKDKLIRSLKKYYPRSKSIAKLNSCKSGVRIDARGNALPFVHSCDHLACPYCYERRQAKSKKVLQAAFTRAGDLVEESKAEDKKTVYAYFITLTVDPKKRGVPRSAKGRLGWFGRELAAFYNRKFVRKHFLASFRRIEATYPGDNVNIHAHATVLSHMLPQDFERRLKKDWKHGFAFEKKWRFGTLHLETTKSQLSADTRLSQYLHKAFSTDIPDKNLAELVEAFTHKRIRTTVSTGLFRKWKREEEERIKTEYREEKEEEQERLGIDPPKPPEGIEPLKEGQYSILFLLELASIGSKYAKYCLRLYEWLKKVGFSREPKQIPKKK